MPEPVLFLLGIGGFIFLALILYIIRKPLSNNLKEIHMEFLGIKFGAQAHNGVSAHEPSTLPVSSKPSAQTLDVGAILYVNVLNFSLLQPDEQEEATNFCSREVEEFLKSIQSEQGINYSIEFHSGDFLLFIERQPNQKPIDTLITAFLFSLQLMLAVRTHPFDLGVTLHRADDVMKLVIMDVSHTVGLGFYHVQEIMAFSGSGHFFISEDAHSLTERLVNLKNTTFGGLLTDLLTALPSKHDSMRNELRRWLSQPEKDYPFKCEEIIFHDRHKHQLHITNFYIEDKKGGTLIGSQALPRHRIAFELDDRRNVLQRAFIQRLVEANEVIILDLTHEETARFLEKALIERQEGGLGFWQNLQIVFPSEAILNTFTEKDRTPLARLQNWQQGKKSVASFLLAQGTDNFTKWQLLEYGGTLSFVGSQFSNYQDASIRIASILPGSNLKENYYMEVFKGMPLFAQLDDSFSVITKNSVRVFEWDLYGRIDNEKLSYVGIVSRARIERITSEGYWLAAALVMVHAHIGDSGRHVSLLQERTIFNADDAHGTLSNISERVNELDFLSAKNISTTREYIDQNYGQDRGDFVATQTFNMLAQLGNGELLTPDIWEVTAIREIKESLGLDVEPARLVFHRFCALRERQILFGIFSLQLKRDGTIDELKIINTLRPHANLHPFDMEKMLQSHRNNQFNRLLQIRFEDVFVPIFQVLNIQ